MLGAIARSIATLVLFPYIRAKVLMQVNKKKQVAADDAEQSQTCAEPKKETIASTLQRVYTEEGPLALYRGLGPELTRVRSCFTVVAVDLLVLGWLMMLPFDALISTTGSALVGADAHDQGEDPDVHHAAHDDRQLGVDGGNTL